MVKIIFHTVRYMNWLFSAAIIACMFSTPSLALSALEKSETSIGSSLPNYRLVNQNGNFFALHSLKGNPVLINYIFTDCHGPCLMISGSVKRVKESINPSIAGNIYFLSISIDILNDTPPLLKEYGESFTDDFDKWIFASMDAQTLEMITNKMGFRFEKTDFGYEHMNRLTLIGPDSKIAKHFYGVKFDPVTVEEAIIATMEGRTVKNTFADTISQALTYCSNYDPVTNTYKIDYGLIISSLIQYLLVAGTVIYIFRKRLSLFASRYFKHGEDVVQR